MKEENMVDIEQAYNEYSKIVYRYLFCLTHNSDKAEELTQETFYRAIKNIDKFEENCKLSVWLCQIAKNLFYDSIKKDKKNVKLTKEDVIDNSFNLEDIFIEQENKVALYQRIHKLDSISKEVVMLRINGELSFKEIGIIFNKSENWANVTFYRAKQKLKGDE